ncbi:DUF2207 domain-containing protein [Methanolapillus millepedarum]|uniref:DUF2207 domain-containing protein n=1 Tax=Methanolapillus millepedarum TaxID=3028296 RepID=A0AA96V2A6_9EURY|nr:hypothetical protein MsAc7_07400 [Methanosarcinaceae archaeon Ac7]
MTFQKNKLTFSSNPARWASIALLVGLCLMLLASGAAAKSYTVDRADVNIVVNESGVVHVNERIYYTFDSWDEDYNEVYRLVYTNSNITIKNATGYIEGYPNSSFRVDNVSYGQELIVKLPKPNPSNVVFVISYDYYGGINVYNDVTEFNYMLWGDNWEKTLPSLNAMITFENTTMSPIPGYSGDSYWSHPSYYTQNMSGRQISNSDYQYTVSASSIPEYTWYDFRVIYPRMENPNGDFVTIQNKDGLNTILNEEKQYERKNLYADLLILIQLLVILAGIVAPFVIYLKYGRERETDYHALYERDLPTNTKPAVVNAIVVGHGKPTMDAFVSTIMYLIDHDYLSIHETTRKDWKNSDTKEILLKIEKQADLYLTDFERDVYLFLRDRMDGDEVEWTKLQKKLGSNDSFYNFLNRWNSKITQKADFSSLFDSTGNKIIGSAGVALLVCSIAMFFISQIIAPANLYPQTAETTSLCFVSGIIAVILLIYPHIWKQSMGRWTKDGRMFYLKWKNFEKYLTDYSLIQEYPPSSVIIWDQFMVYAMALGVADKALKNMHLSVPTASMSDSRLGMIYYYPIFYTGMNRAYSSSTPQSSGGGGGGMGGFGGGGIGGGFGGGGGGAR